MDSLTGLYNHLYLTRKGNELVTARKIFSHHYRISLSDETYQ